jgi:putative transposase
MADHGVVCSMSRSGNVWDNAAMESFFSSLKRAHTAQKGTAPETRRERMYSITSSCFYNPKRRHSTIGSEPYGVREPGGISLTWCPSNRVKATSG